RARRAPRGSAPTRGGDRMPAESAAKAVDRACWEGTSGRPSNIHPHAGVDREPGRLGRHPRIDRETFVCAVRGHVTPAEDVARLRPEDSGLGIESDGRRFVRCLRCDAWLETTPPSAPRMETLPPLDQVE